MRDFSKIAPTFWTGPTGKRIRELGRDAQVVAVYACTAPSANMIGLYYLPLATLCHEVGMAREEAHKALHGLEDVGFAVYDEATEFVWVVNMARYQVGATLKAEDKRVKAVAREWRAARKSPFYRAFHERYGVAFRLPEVVEDEPSEAPSMPLRCPSEGASSSIPQEQEQKKKQEQKREIGGSAEGGALDRPPEAPPVKSAEDGGPVLGIPVTLAGKGKNWEPDLLQALLQQATPRAPRKTTAPREEQLRLLVEHFRGLNGSPTSAHVDHLVKKYGLSLVQEALNRIKGEDLAVATAVPFAVVEAPTGNGRPEGSPWSA